MSIFGDITDDILGDDLNKNISGDELPGSDGENADKDGEPGADEQNEAIKVEPKKRTVRNPRQILKLENLKGNRGLHTIEKYYEDIKFHGKGHEKRDLNEIMKRLQHWGHRMYPNYSFDDVLAKIERLGKKKELQVYMTRYRLGQLEGELMNIANDENNSDNEAPIQDEPFDEFDALLGEQIAISRLAPKTPGSKSNMSISSSVFHTPRLKEHNAAISTPYSRNNDDDLDNLAQPLPLTPIIEKPRTVLTAEQMAKIAENRRKAQERLNAKKAEANATAVNLVE